MHTVEEVGGPVRGRAVRGFKGVARSEEWGTTISIEA